MSDDTKDNPNAIAERIEDEVTGAIGRAEERGRRSERARTGRTPQVVPVSSLDHVREIAEKVFDEKIPAHRLDCMQPGGGLHALGEKVDQLRVSDIKGKLLVSLMVVLVPVAMGIWQNSRANDRLQKQIEVAADVARQLKAVQDAAKVHGELQADAPATQIAQVQP